jgi:hypothetical protein
MKKNQPANPKITLNDYTVIDSFQHFANDPDGPAQTNKISYRFEIRNGDVMAARKKAVEKVKELLKQHRELFAGYSETPSYAGIKLLLNYTVIDEETGSPHPEKWHILDGNRQHSSEIFNALRREAKIVRDAGFYETIPVMNVISRDGKDRFTVIEPYLPFLYYFTASD